MYRLAARLKLTGSVMNTGEGVVIRIQGPEQDVDRFTMALEQELPPAARIASLERKRVSPVPDRGEFVILDSEPGEARTARIPADLATCGDCVEELFDPSDRRHLYPFINCTNCGPRLTIVHRIPYDRALTSMKAFAMCPRCRREYEDPEDRRFHAQPDACPECGPRVTWHDARGVRISATGPDGSVEDPILSASAALRRGEIVAIRGLGGFHLAVDATSSRAVARLRKRKGRDARPFAIMVRDLDAARVFARVSDGEAELLTSARRPIVLIEKKKGSRPALAAETAPALAEVGIMLPYTPVHHILLSRPDCPPALVMTSGNLSDEPICTGNGEAVSRLAGVADHFLLHDREIVTRVDDSVARVAGDGRVRIVRRSRGFVPDPVEVPWRLPRLLACGGMLKNTFCLARGREAFLSQHIGDLDDGRTLDFFEESMEHFLGILELEPECVVHDLHPDYPSTRYALGLGIPAVGVQHHHAHAAAVMAEHRLRGPVVAVILDGAGYGPDGTVWGGEVLLAEGVGYRRLAHLSLLPLPGGDRAAVEPWRMGVAALRSLMGSGFAERAQSLSLGLVSEYAPKLEVIGQMIERGVNTPLTSSCGRLFDAVAALLGIRFQADYEGQAAMELEALARKAVDVTDPYRLALRKSGAVAIIDSNQLIECLLDDLQKGVPRELAAARFHDWLIRNLARLCAELCRETGTTRVVLGGGCMQNVVLLTGLLDRLEEEGLQPFAGCEIPANDGGISLGQAVIGGLTYVSRDSNAGSRGT